MAISRTSSPSGTESREALSAELLLGFSDELSKIAAEAQPNARELEKQKMKRLAKAGLLYTAGATAGYGTALLADEAVRRTVGKSTWWNQMKPKTRYGIMGPIGAAIGIGSVAAQQYTQHRYQQKVTGADE